VNLAEQDQLRKIPRKGVKKYLGPQFIEALMRPQFIAGLM
jgi:hypothetical protein